MQKAKTETQQVRNRVAEETQTLESELARVSEELRQSESRLPGDVFREYSRIVVKRGEDTLSETDLDTCGQCFTKLSPQTISELLMKKIVYCKTCGSIMYAKENSPSPG